MTAPKKRPGVSADKGWRKAAVCLAAIVAISVLQGVGALTTEVALYILGTAGAFIGANLTGYIRGAGKGH